MIARGLLDRDQAGRALELARRDRLSLSEAASRLGLLPEVSTPDRPASTISGVASSAASFESRPRVRPEPGLTLGELELVRKLGEGGMGVVFLARVGLTEVAIKFLGEALTPDALLRFEREAEAAAAVDRHPNVVHIHRVVHTAAGPAIVLDYVEGESFDVTLRREGPLPADRALDIALPIVRALGHVHRNGIVHRDLKPANVLIRSSDGAPLLGDFGLARVLDAETLTRTGEMLGTPRSMAPEQVTGRSVDARADIWAVGVLLYEAITGRAPFEGETVVQLCQAICRQSPRPPGELVPELPAAVGAVILRCLEKAPEDRPASAAELEAMLLAARSGRGPARQPGRLGLAVAAGLIALLLIGIAASGLRPGGGSAAKPDLGRAWLEKLARLPTTDKALSAIRPFLIAPVAGPPAPRSFAEQKALRQTLVAKLARHAELKPELNAEQQRRLLLALLLLRLETGEEAARAASLVDATSREAVALLAGDDAAALRQAKPGMPTALIELAELRVAALELAAGHLAAAREALLPNDAAAPPETEPAREPGSARDQLILELLARRVIQGPDEAAEALLVRLADAGLLKRHAAASDSPAVRSLSAAIRGRFAALERRQHGSAEPLLALHRRLEMLRETSPAASVLLPKSPRGRLLTLALAARAYDPPTMDTAKLFDAFKAHRRVVRIDHAFHLPDSFPRRYVAEALTIDLDTVGRTPKSVLDFYLDGARLGVYFEDLNHQRIATMVPMLRELLAKDGADPYLKFWLARSMPNVPREQRDTFETQLLRSLELMDASLASEDLNDAWRSTILAYRVKRLIERLQLEVGRPSTPARETRITELVDDAAASLRELEQLTLVLPEMLPSCRYGLTIQLQSHPKELLKVLSPSVAATLRALPDDEARVRALAESLGWEPVEITALMFNLDRTIGGVVSAVEVDGPAPERRGERLAFALSRMVQPNMLDREWTAVRERERLGHVEARGPHERALYDLLPIPVKTFEAIEEGILRNLVRVDLELDHIRAAERRLFETPKWAGAMRRQRSLYRRFYHWQTRALMARELTAPTLVVSIADRLRIARRAKVLDGPDPEDSAERQKEDADIKRFYLQDLAWLEKRLDDRDGAVRRYLAAASTTEARRAELLWLWVEKTWTPKRILNALAAAKKRQARSLSGRAPTPVLDAAIADLSMAEALLRSEMTEPAARRVADRAYWTLNRCGQKARRDALAARWAPVADSPEFLHLRCEAVYRAIGSGRFEQAEERLTALVRDHGRRPELRAVSGSFVDQCARHNREEAFQRGLAIYRGQLDMSKERDARDYWRVVFKRGDYLIRNRRDAEAAAILAAHKDQAGTKPYEALAEKVRDPEAWRRQVEDNRRRRERMRGGR